MTALAIAAVQRRVSHITHKAESKRTHTPLAQSVSHHSGKVCVWTQRKGWGMGKVLHFRARRSGGLRGGAELVALSPGLQLPAGQLLKLKLPQLRHRTPSLPITDVALANVQGGSGGDLSPVELDDVVVGHGQYYGATHTGLRINSPYRDGTIDKMETIGARIRVTRKALGLNQTELAKAIGIDQSTVSDIENGALFGADVLMALSKALLKSPQFLMTGQAEATELSDFEAKMIAAYRKASPPAPAPAQDQAPMESELIGSRIMTNPAAGKAGKKRKVG